MACLELFNSYFFECILGGILYRQILCSCVDSMCLVDIDSRTVVIIHTFVKDSMCLVDIDSRTVVIIHTFVKDYTYIDSRTVNNTRNLKFQNLNEI